MSNISFQGHRRRKGFNPIQVPNQSQKILAESERTIRGMRDVQKAQIQGREDFIEIKQQNERKVAFQNEKNEDLRKQFAKGYLKAELQHLETKIKDVSPGGGDYMNFQTREKLKELIPKAIQSVANIQEMRLANATKKMVAIGSNQYFKSPEEIFALKQQYRNIGWAEQSINKAKLRWEREGVNEDTIAHLSSLSGMELLATTNLYLAEQGKNGFKNWITPSPEGAEGGGGYVFVNPRTGHNLASLQVNGTPEQHREHLNFLEREFKTPFSQFSAQDGTKDLEGASLDAIALHMDPYIQETKQGLMNAFSEKHKGRLKEAAIKASSVKLRNALWSFGGPNGGYGTEQFIDYINQESGGETSQMPAVIARSEVELQGMILSGEMNIGHLSNIADGETTINGKKDLLRNHPQYKGMFQRLFKHANERLEAEVTANETQEIAWSNNMKSHVFETAKVLKRPLNREEITEVKELIVSRGYDPAGKNFSWLTDYQNAEEAEIADQMKLFEGIEKQGTLTLAKLYLDPTIHPQVIEKFKDKAKDSFAQFDTSIQTKLRNSITNTVASQAKKGGTPAALENRSGQTLALSAIALEEYQIKGAQYVASGAYKTPIEAWTAASTDLIKEITGPDGKGTGYYKLNLNSDGSIDYDRDTAGFAYFGNIDIDVKGDEYYKQARTDNNFIYLSSDEEGVSKADVQILKQTLNRTNNLTYPSFIKQIKKAYPNKTLNEVANIVLEANGEDPVEPRGLSRVERYIHPTFKKLITNNCSLARCNRATEATTKIMNPDVDPKEVELEMSKTPNAIAADPENNGHDAITTPNTTGTTTGTEMFGKSITEMTTGEISGLQNQGRLGEVGAFGIDGKTLKYYLYSGLVDPEAPFDDVTQRTIALENNIDLAGTFFADADSYQKIYGVGQSWYTEESELMTPISGLGPLAVKALQITADESLEKIGKGFELAGEAVKEEVLNPVGEGFKIAGETTQAAAKKYVTDPVDATVQQVGEGFQIAAETIQDTSKRLVYDPTMAATKAVQTQFKNLWDSQITERVERWEEALTQYILMKQQLAGQGWDVYKFRPEVEGVLMNHTIKNYFEVE